MKWLAPASLIVLLASSLSFASATAFIDVSSKTSYAEAIEYTQAKGYVQGYSDGTFRPSAAINRAEFVKILMSARSLPETIARCLENVKKSPWSDTNLTDWFARFLCVAKKNNVIDGYPDGHFGPADPINAAEAAKIVINAYGLGPLPANGAAWYAPYVQTLNDLGAMPGSIVALDRAITRAEMTEMIYRMDTATGAASGSSSLSSMSDISDEPTEEHDISYGKNPLQTLDILSDDSFGSQPIVVLFHGGGWRQGDKQSMHALGSLLRDWGFVVVIPNYRLTADGKTQFPDPVEDAACAVAWTLEHAVEIGGNASRIAVGGESAGAHLAAMIAYDENTDWSKNCESAISPSYYGAFLGIVGPYDFSLVKNTTALEAGAAFLGPLNDPSKWSVAEPIHYVSQGDPPAFILGGEKDTFVGTQNSPAFADALTQKGIDSKLVIAPGATHTTTLEYLLGNPTMKAELRKFLEAKF